MLQLVQPAVEGFDRARSISVNISCANDRDPLMYDSHSQFGDHCFFNHAMKDSHDRNRNNKELKFDNDNRFRFDAILSTHYTQLTNSLLVFTPKSDAEDRELPHIPSFELNNTHTPTIHENSKMCVDSDEDDDHHLSDYYLCADDDYLCHWDAERDDEDQNEHQNAPINKHRPSSIAVRDCLAISEREFPEEFQNLSLCLDVSMEESSTLDSPYSFTVDMDIIRKQTIQSKINIHNDLKHSFSNKINEKKYQKNEKIISKKKKKYHRKTTNQHTQTQTQTPKNALQFVAKTFVFDRQVNDIALSETACQHMLYIMDICSDCD